MSQHATEDLQSLVDDLSAKVGLPTQLTDQRMLSLAFGPHTDVIDWVRQETLLQRTTSPTLKAYFDGFRVTTSREPVRIPADREQGLLPRVVVPVRWRGITYGLLWFLDKDGDLVDGLLEHAVEVAAVIARHLDQASRSRRDQADQVRKLVDTDALGRAEAAGVLLDRGLFPASAPVTAVVLLLGEQSEVDTLPLEALSVVGPSSLPRTVPRFVDPSHAVLLVAASAGQGDEAADTAQRARTLLEEACDGKASVVAGIGDAQPDLASAAASYRQAWRAARAAQRVPQAGPIALWRGLGALRPLMALPVQSLEEGLDPRVRRLVEREPLLLHTVETYLQHAGDVKLTGVALNVHRGTVYYRLRKVEEVSGLDLRNGEDVLTLHLGMKLLRLLPRSSGRTSCSRGAATDRRADPLAT